MIKTNISNCFPHQYLKYKFSDKDLFITDYTNQTKNLRIRRGVELFEEVPPTDINYFTVKNPNKFNVGYIDFDNSSFTFGNNTPRSQCECVLFPNVSTNESWLLFCELKYSSHSIYNEINLKKALKQLYRTRYYYFQKNIFEFSNTSYLIASLPLQTPPFINFSIPQPILTKVKKKRNIILKLTNSLTIKNNNTILV